MDREITILSIDDDKEILYALKAIFDFQGWKSILALDVESGLKAFLDNKPDIILIDYHLPRINGIDGVYMLRQLSPTIPIIVFTIDESQEVANRFLEVGASDFALKPIKTPDLISRINLHIQLMNRDPDNSFYTFNILNSEKEIETSLPKGISFNTLDLIKQNMDNKEFYTVESIVKSTGLAYQTVYRYLQYMESAEIIEVHITYGKVGRPKNSYRLL
jgi:response regulator of citrate/malate metabolism